MDELCGIVVDLDVCFGCFACEIACKQENDVPIGNRWIQVVAIGPKRLDGRLQMDFLPVITEGCTLCNHRLKEGLEPRCVDNCPVQALKFCRDTTEVLAALRSGKRSHVSKLKGKVTAFG
ncbi:oxidoreductase [Chloroflexota bacterium]